MEHINKLNNMKKYMKPIIIGLIAGALPYLFGFPIVTIGWWILMPIFSLVIWFGIEVFKYIRR